MQRGLVLDAAGNPLAPDAAYVAGATIHYYRELEHEHEIPFEAQVLYRDAHLLIADKPHFLPVVPSGRFVQQTLLVRLKRETRSEEHTSELQSLMRHSCAVFCLKQKKTSQSVK